MLGRQEGILPPSSGQYEQLIPTVLHPRMVGDEAGCFKGLSYGLIIYFSSRELSKPELPTTHEHKVTAMMVLTEISGRRLLLNQKNPEVINSSLHWKSFCDLHVEELIFKNNIFI